MGFLTKLAGLFGGGAGETAPRARSTGYQAAKLNRLTERLHAQARTRYAEQIGNADGRRLRDIARHLVRNVPEASRAVDYVASAVVGPGIYPQFTTGDRALDLDLEQWFADLALGIEYRDGRSWRVVQEMAVREMIVAGEAFSVAARSGSRYAIEVFESEQLDAMAVATQLGAGEQAVRGVVYSREGRRVAYLVESVDAGLMGSAGSVLDVRRIPANRVAHVYRSFRPSQFRGISEMGPVAIALSDLQELDWAWLTTLRTHAGVSLWLKTPSDGVGEDALAGIGATDREESEAGQADTEINWEPGTVMSGPEEPTVLQSHVPSGEAQAFRVALLKGVAAALGIPYSALGDVERANYSSERAAEMHCRPGIARRQDLLVEGFCRRHLLWAMRVGVASGEVRLPRGLTVDQVVARSMWPLPGREWVDPRAESLAMESRLRTGVWSFSDACAAHGRDAMEQLEALAREREQFAAAGLVHPHDLLNAQATAMGVSAGDGSDGEDDPADDSSADQQDDVEEVSA